MSSPDEDLRRQELLDCAAELIAQQGLESCTFRRLAEHAGSSTGLFTYYFPSRNDLIRALLLKAAELAWDNERFDEEEPEDPLATLLQASRKAVQIEPELDPYKQIYDQVQIAAPYHPEWIGLLREIEAWMLPRYLRLILRAQESGQISADIDPGDLLRKIWALGDGLNIQRYIDPDEITSVEVERIFVASFYALIKS